MYLTQWEKLTVTNKKKKNRTALAVYKAWFEELFRGIYTQATPKFKKIYFKKSSINFDHIFLP